MSWRSSSPPSSWASWATCSRVFERDRSAWLGCPRCYEAFRGELMPLLQRIHEAQAHTGRLPSTSVPDDPEAAVERDELQETT